MGFGTLDDVDVAGKRVLVRVDLNVPMADGRVTDVTRMDRVVPTIIELSDRGARVIMLSHFGRPKGKVVRAMSLAPVASAFADILGRPVAFAADPATAALSDGDILLMENTRFHTGEEANAFEFSRDLAALGDIYVNDAFSAAHRAHASTEGIAHLLPAVAGRAMQSELEHLEMALDSPARPVVAVVGGAKVSSKIALLENLVGRVDHLVIGGGMANTFLAARGINVSKSLCEHDLTGTALQIMENADKAGCRIVLPVDVVIADGLEAGTGTETVDVGAVPADKAILDIGPASLADLTETFRAAKTIVWNGPLGAFEFPPFDAGTNGAAREAAALTRAGSVTSVAGGGDTVAALAHAGVAEEFTYVSTAGGAFLEWLEGRKLPGVTALEMS